MGLLLAILIKVLAWIAGVIGAMLGYSVVKDYHHTGTSSAPYTNIVRSFSTHLVLQAVVSGALLALWSLFR